MCVADEDKSDDCALREREEPMQGDWAPAKQGEGGSLLRFGDGAICRMQDGSPPTTLRHLEQLMTIHERGLTSVGTLGVVVFVKRHEHGVVVTFDDVRATSPTAWQLKSFFTERPTSDSDVRDVSMSEAELADVGLAIMSRLAVLEEEQRRRSPTG
jgi:hypothetical protein